MAAKVGERALLTQPGSLILKIECIINDLGEPCKKPIPFVKIQLLTGLIKITTRNRRQGYKQFPAIGS